MKIAAAAIALSFASLALLLEVDASPARTAPASRTDAPAAGQHVGQGENRPL